MTSPTSAPVLALETVKADFTDQGNKALTLLCIGNSTFFTAHSSIPDFYTNQLKDGIRIDVFCTRSTNKLTISA